MAITEFEPDSQPDFLPEQPSLHAVNPGGVLGESVSIVPVDAQESVTVLRPVEAFEDFRTTLHALIRGGEYDSKSTEELTEIKTDVEAVRESLTTRYAELAKLEAILQQEMTWTNGYLIDLNKAIGERQITDSV